MFRLVLHPTMTPGAEIHAVDVLQSPVLRSTLKEFSSWPTFPQVRCPCHNGEERRQPGPRLDRALLRPICRPRACLRCLRSSTSTGSSSAGAILRRSSTQRVRQEGGGTTLRRRQSATPSPAGTDDLPQASLPRCSSRSRRSAGQAVPGSWKRAFNWHDLRNPLLRGPSPRARGAW